jgi:hypothetical protein
MLGLFIFGYLPASVHAGSFQDPVRVGGSPEESAAACAKLEADLAVRPGDRDSAEQLSLLYASAGVSPLVSLPGRFRRLEDLSLDGSPVRCYREGADGDTYLIHMPDGRYRYFLRTEGRFLAAKIGGFGPLRTLARVESSEPSVVLKAASAALSDLRLLEEIGSGIRKAAGTDVEPEVLTRAADRLTGALRENGTRHGLLEELVHVYDRLGEFTVGTGREPGYRRLQIAAAARLAEELPEASTTRRSLALLYFRLGAYPLAAEEIRRAKEDPVARDLGELLRAWSQAEHQKQEGFTVEGGYLVDAYLTQAEAPDSAELFAELSYIVRRAKRPEFAVYTLCSQKLKTRRHWYLYFSYLGERRLLTTYADQRPTDAAVRERVGEMIRLLAEAPKKDQ